MRGGHTRAEDQKIGLNKEIIMKDGFVDDHLETLFAPSDFGFFLGIITDEEDPCLPCHLIIILFEAISADVPVEDIDIDLRVDGL
jgi:hypothetical protein